MVIKWESSFGEDQKIWSMSNNPIKNNICLGCFLCDENDRLFFERVKKWSMINKYYVILKGENYDNYYNVLSGDKKLLSFFMNIHKKSETFLEVTHKLKVVQTKKLISQRN